MRGVSAGKAARHFVDNSLFNCGSQTNIIDGKGTYFTYKFLLHVYRILNVHNSFTTTSHLQTTGHVEKLNRIIRVALQAYIDAHHRDWNDYESSLVCSYNIQHQTRTSVVPLDVVLSKPPGSIAASLPPTKYKGPLGFKHNWKKLLTKVIA